MKKPPQKVAYLCQVGGFFSAAPTSSPELHFRFINSFIQPSRVESLTASYEDPSIAKILTKFDKAVARTIIPWSFKYCTAAYIFFTPFFTAVYIVERLVLQTFYVLNTEILQFFGLKSAVYN